MDAIIPPKLLGNKVSPNNSQPTISDSKSITESEGCTGSLTLYGEYALYGLGFFSVLIGSIQYFNLTEIDCIFLLFLGMFGSILFILFMEDPISNTIVYGFLYGLSYFVAIELCLFLAAIWFILPLVDEMKSCF